MKISEIFYSIQGEGLHIGLPTVFLRLFACDLRCNWCDTMYAVEGTEFENLTESEILNKVSSFGCKRLCITGGEPLLQQKELLPLVKKLLENDYYIVLETSGHREPPEIFFGDSCLISMDCKCPGSGMTEKMDYKLFEQLRPTDQLKFVISDIEDYEYSKKILEKLDIDASIIFQPVYGKNLKWLTEKVLEDKLERVRVLPQLHKSIWGEKKGV